MVAWDILPWAREVGAIAILIDSVVTDFCSDRMNIWIRIVAIAATAIGVESVAIGIGAAASQILTVAVLVDSIAADFRCGRMNIGIRIIAIHRINKTSSGRIAGICGASIPVVANYGIIDTGAA